MNADAVSPPKDTDFLSGESGEVSGLRATGCALLRDAACEGLALARLEPWRLRAAARELPARRVLVLSIVRTDRPNLFAAARRELERSHHAVEVVHKAFDGVGKFESLRALLDTHAVDGRDWLIFLDDDVALPRGFLDVFLFLAERFELALAQPAHRWRSHGGWRVTRRRPGLVAHETRFVEIGPVTALHARTFATLLPPPPLVFGWGLDLHWSAVAHERGWRQGVIDAVPIQHVLRRVASGYSHAAAIVEARRFLAEHPFLPAGQAAHATRGHSSWS